MFRRWLPVVIVLATGMASGADVPSVAAQPQGGQAVYLPVALQGATLRRLRPPTMSPAGGVHALGVPLVVRLELADPTAEIRYTLDGSVPTRDRGHRYRGPLSIAGTTVLRAATFRDGWQPSGATTATYLFPEDVPDQGPSPEGWPASWGIYPEGPEDAVGGYRGRPVPADYGLDPRVTGAADEDGVVDPERRASFVAALGALPSVSIVVDPDDLFAADGIYANPLADREGWRHPTTGIAVALERPASIEWLGTDGRAAFQVDAGVRIAGGWSRKPDGMAKHSFSLRFRKRYGVGRLRYPIFAGAPNGAGAGAPDSFDALRLRAGQADTFLYFPGKAQYVHDQWARDTQRAMSGVGARGTWVHLYLNGLHWGLYNLSEEIDADFAADNLGGEAQDWDVIKAADRDDVDAMGTARPVAAPTGEPAQFALVEDGREQSFRSLLAARDGGSVADPEARAAVLGLLDLPQVIDDHLLHLYLDVWDWHKNWRAVRNRRSGGGFRFLTWDAEHVLGLRQDPTRPGVCGPLCSRDCPPVSCGERTDAAGIAGLHRWLVADADYRLAFADRVRLHLLDGGALAPEPSAARFRALSDHVSPGILAESARWGDVIFGERTRSDNYGFVRRYQQRPGEPSRLQTREGDWLPERDRLLGELFPHRSGALLAQLCQTGLYPPVAAPALRPEGAAGLGEVAHPVPGASSGAAAARAEGVLQVRIALLEEGCAGQARGGRIWYTRDGSDPRDPHTGEPAAGARAYLRPIAAPPRGPGDGGPGYLVVAARMRGADGRWSAIARGRFNRPRVVVDELFYHPPSRPDGEWLELRNLEKAAVDLSGWRIEGGVTATVPAGTIVAPLGRAVLAADASIFDELHPGLPLAGTYQGHLSNGGEDLRLVSPGGVTAHAPRYDDEGFWPLAPDGLGWSLVLTDPAADPRDSQSWRASAEAGGSPGAPDPQPPWSGRVVINEVLGASAAPYEDAVELHNPGDAPIDVSGWWLSDDRDEPFKFALPTGSVMAPGGYVTVYDAQFRDPAPPDQGFGLSARGETLYLRGRDGDGRPNGYFHGLRYGAADDNVSFGRVRTAAGLHATALTRPTFGVRLPTDVADFRRGTGAANAPPYVGPLIVDELLARPGADAAEFIELRARGDAPVLLGGDPSQGSGPWAFLEGLRFTFPAGSRLGPGERMLLVGVDPLAFRAAFDVPSAVPIHGPWQGSLDPDGESLVLARPRRGEASAADAGFVEEELRWRVTSPWPAVGLRAGASLERRDPPGWSGDPASWRAVRVGGTPGRGHALPYRVWLPWNDAWR